jgi:hypothetical protein
MINWSRAFALVVLLFRVTALAVSSENSSESEFKGAVKFFIHAQQNSIPEEISKDPSKAVFEIIELCKAQDNPAQKGLCLRALGRALVSFKVSDKAATAAREELSDALKSDKAEVRENAMRTIAQLDKEKATDVLLKLVDDPDYSIEAGALELLGYWGDPKMAPRLQEILKRRADAAKDIPQRASTENLFQVDGAQALAKMRARGSSENSKP